MKTSCKFGGNLQKLCTNVCNHCFNRSFASHPKAKFWSLKLNHITPRNVSISSGKKFWFTCNIVECRHLFHTTLAHVNDGRWCPYCSKPAKKLCEDVHCDACFEKSFASHPKASFWHSSLNDISPRESLKSSHKKFWFVCDNETCSHNFEASLGNITSNDRWCPYCANPPQRLCTTNECDKCFNKTFANHPKAKFWHSKNKMRPDKVFMSSGMKFWFTCDVETCGYEFESSPNAITSNGHWCPYCRNKTENLLYQWFLDNGFAPERQPKFKWCKNLETGRFLPFDFLIDNTIIELDGRQHFEQISNWAAPELTQIRDSYKERRAIANGYSVIRLLQEEVWDTLNQLVVFETDEPYPFKWQTLLMDLLASHDEGDGGQKGTVKLISGDANWPGSEGYYIIEIDQTPNLNFIPFGAPQ